MRRRPYILLILPALVLTLAADRALALDAAAYAECIDGAHHVRVTGQYIEEVGGEIYDGEIAGLVFECQAIGSCAPSFFYPETPLPFDPQPSDDGWPVYEAEMTIEPPIEGVAYRYIPYGVRPDGTLVSTYHACDADSRSYALVGCAGVPIARGVVVIDQEFGDNRLFRILMCPAARCWSELLYLPSLDVAALEAAAGVRWRDLVGMTVNVYGTRTYCSMPGGDSHEISRMSLSLDYACAFVQTEDVSWDGLKAMYR